MEEAECGHTEGFLLPIQTAGEIRFLMGNILRKSEGMKIHRAEAS